MAANTFDPGDFKVSMNQSSGGDSQGQPPIINCTVAGRQTTLGAYMENFVTKWTDPGSPPSATCTSQSELTQTNRSLTGTVTNRSIGDGDILQTCDMSKSTSLSFTYAVTADGSTKTGKLSDLKFSVSGYQACAWSMSFRDTQATKLSGTVEQTFSGSTDANLADCPAEYSKWVPDPTKGTMLCVPVVTTAKVYVVGGSGYFEDTGGEGSFTDQRIYPLLVPKSGSVSGASLSRMISGLVPQADTTQTASAMKMALLKGAKASVRLVSPAPVSGKRSLGVGPDGSTQVQVKVSAAPGAACSISAKSGSKTKTLSASKKDSDGMVTTSITAATVKSKLAAKTGAKVTLSVYCKVGSKTAKSDQSVTLGA